MKRDRWRRGGKRLRTRYERRHRNGKLLLILGAICLVLFMIYVGLIYGLTAQKGTMEITVCSEFDSKEAITMNFLGERNVSWWFKATDTVNTKSVGEYHVIYAPRFFFGKTIERTFIVVDKEKPEIILEPMEEGTVLTSIDCFEEPGYLVTDNYDTGLTDKVTTEVRRLKPYWYEIVYRVEDSSGNVGTAKREVNVISGVVCLTFDDGPSYLTPNFLDILKRNGVKATFFMLGFEKEKETIVKRVAEEGHTVGYHGYSHQYSEIYTSLDALMSNFYRLEIQLNNLLGTESTKLIRFPGGTSNTVSRNYCEGIMSEAVKRVQEEGYMYFDWNVDSQDAGGATTAEAVYANVRAGIRSGRQNVVLMHDTKQHTLEALQWIIDYCFENDYVFEALSSDSKPVFHRTSN